MNVIVIAIDTLRADHVGCYGYERPTSPHMDGLAAESVLFEQHIAAAIPTHPSFTTFNTGQFSATHGVVAHGGHHSIPREAPWLPSLLNKAGYTTCAVDNLSQWRMDFHRGFEFYIDPTQRSALSIQANNRSLNKRVLPFLEQHKDEQFYLFVHYWDPHTPYLPPRAYRKLFYQGDPCDPSHRSLEGMEERHPLGKLWRETWFSQLGGDIRDAAYIEALYDGEIRYCDEGVGQLLDAVDRLGLSDDTVVVLTSDHGEMMYRHGIFFDHHGLYEGNLHVPLMIRAPGLSPGRIPGLTATVDVAPTVLDLCGIEAPEDMEGISLAPWLRGDTAGNPRDFVVSQESTWQMKWALRTERHKFILSREADSYGTPMRELYDLKNDPAELHSIVEEEGDLAAALEAQLEGWVAEKMEQNGLKQDPLITHGLSLGK
jgi:arylsulfatase